MATKKGSVINVVSNASKIVRDIEKYQAKMWTKCGDYLSDALWESFVEITKATPQSTGTGVSSWYMGFVDSPPPIVEGAGAHEEYTKGDEPGVNTALSRNSGFFSSVEEQYRYRDIVLGNPVDYTKVLLGEGNLRPENAPGVDLSDFESNVSEAASKEMANFLNRGKI